MIYKDWATDMKQDYMQDGDKTPEHVEMKQTKITLSWFGFWLAVGAIVSTLVAVNG